MDMLFNLETVQQSIVSYDKIIEDIHQALESSAALKEGIPKRTWSGEGRESFNRTFDVWLGRTKVVLEDIRKTRECLAAYAANRGIDLKDGCERFGDVY